MQAEAQRLADDCAGQRGEVLLNDRLQYPEQLQLHQLVHASVRLHELAAANHTADNSVSTVCRD
ncbi:hypothetical protein EON64_07990 [archaeon]|nr:MAG: hypothetical protein EON64_07990 [archaeon]